MLVFPRQRVSCRTKAGTGVVARLRSIADDSKFIDAVRRTYPEFAFFANLRAGLWYAPSALPCYFKSTDGHSGVWQFSTTRLNLFVAELAAVSSGAIIVDSTKRGKPFPDSLTKTVPVWCSIVNHLVLGLSLDSTPFSKLAASLEDVSHPSPSRLYGRPHFPFCC